MTSVGIQQDEQRRIEYSLKQNAYVVTLPEAYVIAAGKVEGQRSTVGRQQHAASMVAAPLQQPIKSNDSSNLHKLSSDQLNKLGTMTSGQQKVLDNASVSRTTKGQPQISKGHPQVAGQPRVVVGQEKQTIKQSQPVPTTAIRRTTTAQSAKSSPVTIPKSKSSSIPTSAADAYHRCQVQPRPSSSAAVFDVVPKATAAHSADGQRPVKRKQETVATEHPSISRTPPRPDTVFDIVDHTQRRSPKNYPPTAAQTSTPRSTGLLFYPVPGDSCQSSDSRRTVSAPLSQNVSRNGPVYNAQQQKIAQTDKPYGGDKGEKTGLIGRPFIKQPTGQPDSSGEDLHAIPPGKSIDSKSDERKMASFNVADNHSALASTSSKYGNESGAKATTDNKSAASRLFIKGGQVINDDTIITADVFVEDGVIKQIGPHLTVPGGARVVDAKGKYVIPGGIDPHTHLQMPFFGTTAADDFYSGTKAAVAGGTTMIIDFVVGQKNDSLLASYDKYRGMADPKVCCDYGLSVIVNHMSDKVKNEMAELVKSKGINAFKFFMAYKDVFMIRDDEMYQGFLQCKKLGALARVHAENGDVIAAKEKEMLACGVTGPEGHLQSRPEEVEAEATNRACMLAGQANCPLYVVHVMCKPAAEAINRARCRGNVVFGEAVVAGLASDGTHYFDKCWKHAAAHVISPPLRTDLSTGDYLLDLLAAGQLQLTGSDHAVFNSTQKALGKNDFTKIPNGVNGLEERMMLTWELAVNSGKMDPMKFVSITSSMAAKLFNIYPKKGRIAEGSDADIVIWDPESHHTISAATHHSNIDFNIFEGRTCHGVPWMTIAGGKVVFEDGQVKVTQGAGKFVPLPPYSTHVYSTILQREKVRVPIKVDRDGTATAAKPATAPGAAPISTPSGTPAATTPSPQPVPVTPSFDDIPVGAKHANLAQDFHKQNLPGRVVVICKIRRSL